MIRDPSDGSVREVTPEEDKLLRKALVASGTVVQPVLDTATSGLQSGSAKPENIARLEKSREWLKNYRSNPLQYRSGQQREGN